MQFENMTTFVRAIKGAPASVLWALIITQRMMTALELQQWTGYKGDNITVSVRLLIELGWVVARTPRGPWGLAEGRQLPLMPGIEQLQGFEKRDSDLIGVAGASSSSSSNRLFLSSYRQEQEEEGDDSDLIGVKPECVAACLAAGIGEPTRSKLSAMAHVTPEFIAAHVQQAKDQEQGIGTAIYRIKNNWAVDPKYLPKENKPVNVRSLRGKIQALRNRSGDDEE